MNNSLGIGIIDFFENPFILNIKNLSAVQKMVLKVIVGEPLDTTTPILKTHPMQDIEFANEVEMFKFFSGKDTYVPGKKYADPSLCWGRRSGKSLVISAGLALYYATQKDWKPYLGTSPFVTVAIVSPTRAQSQELFVGIKRLLLKSPYLFQTFLNGNIEAFQEEYSEDQIGDGASLVGGMIQFNNKVVIRTISADISRLRGSAIALCILDEAAWLGSDEVKNSDVEVFNAVQPATAQFGNEALIIKSSSPNGESGLMYNDFTKQKEDDVLHFQIPTWYANPSITVEYLNKQRKLRGEYYFQREYAAKYTASENAYLDPASIDRCVIRGMEVLDPNPKFRYVAAIDYASRNDYWTFNISHKEYHRNPDTKEVKERIFIDFCKSWHGEQSNELDPSVIIPEICHHMHKYGVVYCVSDQFSYAALKVFFQKEGCLLKEFKLAAESKLKYMFSLQIAVNSDVLRLVHNPLAIQHLKNLKEKRSANGQLRVEHASGTHDDYACSIALCVYQFDKTSPIYIGSYEADESKVVETTDLMGRQIAAPTASEVAGMTGNLDFEDNSDTEKEEEKDVGFGMWYIF